jgi:DNA uptake protein ComE-like DNA-binding protein
MVESASINKSLFVLAQCVEAISKKHPRIPYRESKMTRILSLGQNNGLTLMILNLAPVRSYHLETLSSLNFANRTKKIEVHEVENEPIFKGPPRPAVRSSGAGSMQRQPLRPLAASINTNLTVTDPSKTDEKKPVKAFFVYSDKQQAKSHAVAHKPEALRRSSPLKRTSDGVNTITRPAKSIRYVEPDRQIAKTHKDISAAKIEELVEKKVEEILAARALDDSSRHQAQVNEINEQVQRRLELLEKRIEGTEDARAEGLSYLLMAKQHHARGEDPSALRMYKLALPFFPQNEKLAAKISTLEEKIRAKQQTSDGSSLVETYDHGQTQVVKKQSKGARARRTIETSDDEYADSDRGEKPNDEENGLNIKPKQKRAVNKSQRARFSPGAEAETEASSDLAVVESTPDEQIHSPRTAQLLSVINSRDISQIKLLKGVGAKKAEAIVDCLCEMDLQTGNADYAAGSNNVDQARVKSLAELGRMKGVGLRTVQNMRSGILV